MEKRKWGKLTSHPSPAFVPLFSNQFSVFPDETLAQKQAVDSFHVCFHSAGSALSTSSQGSPNGRNPQNGCCLQDLLGAMWVFMEMAKESPWRSAQNSSRSCETVQRDCLVMSVTSTHTAELWILVLALPSKPSRLCYSLHYLPLRSAGMMRTAHNLK